MRTMNRNKQLFHYCLYLGKENRLDDEGYETGEPVTKYSEAVPMSASISAATGTSQVEQFGSFINYDKVIVTDDLSCPIDEHSVLFVDKAPEYAEDGTPQYDYVVHRVARSLNFIAYAVGKVKVS